MRTITLDLERMTSVPAMHKYLRSALALPVYYGANLDALYDCLTEIAEPTQIIVPADITDNESWAGMASSCCRCCRTQRKKTIIYR